MKLAKEVRSASGNTETEEGQFCRLTFGALVHVLGRLEPGCHLGLAVAA